MAKKKSMVKQMIDEALSKADGAQFIKDPEMEDESEISGPERFAKGQKKKDEIVIDAQLADMATQDGYFAKIKKEMRPGLGEWMLMKTVETEWRQWADVELAVAKIVKEHTRTAPLKWGSGAYRVEYGCVGGTRGKNYPNKDVFINADEEFITPNTMNGQLNATATPDPAVAVSAQISSLAELVNMLKNFLPQASDPGKTQDQIAGAFKEGMSLKAGESSSNNQMMMTMMTGLMGMMTAMATNNNRPMELPKVVNPTEGLTGMLEVMKTFGVLGDHSKEKPKSFTDTLLELKAVGVDIFKKDDPMEQMGKLKQFASIASDLMGIGGTAERPGILEKVVDMLGPAIPGMVKDIKDTMGNAVQAQVEAGRNIERAKLPGPSPVSEGAHMNVGGNVAQAPVANAQANPQVQAFFNGLYEAVKMNNRMYYPLVYTSLIQDPKGVELINGIANSTHTAKELIEMLQGYGDPRFRDSEFVLKQLVSYTNGFIIWIREMLKPKAYTEMQTEQVKPVENIPVQQAQESVVAEVKNQVDVECLVCKTVFVFDSLEEFMAESLEDKICGQNGCIGELSPLKKAQ